MLDVLLVDDEPTIRLSVGDALRSAGHRVCLAGDGAEALESLNNELFDVVVTDVRLPKTDGLEIFRRAKEMSPGTAVLLVTAYGDVADAVNALKEGAQDYVTKPFDNEEMVLRIERAGEQLALKRQLDQARKELESSGMDARIVGSSPGMRRLLDRVATMGASDAPVLISGESGSGKELVARSLHTVSPRKDRPFVAINCAAFPETLIEAELFGHERGAFTGAVRRREGRFKAANGGTLFLDEVAELPLMVQAKLLRVLQDGTIEPLGTNTPLKVDVRIISATHRNLKERISEALFREDLYYRLNVLDIRVPPLRERRSDLPVLVEHFLRKFLGDEADLPSISPRAWAALSEYDFPGNVRELEHAIQHALVLSRGETIDIQHLPEDVAGQHLPSDQAPEPGGLRPLATAVKEFEREYLQRALGIAEGKKTRAAELLGISRKNLWEKMRALNLSERAGEPSK